MCLGLGSNIPPWLPCAEWRGQEGPYWGIKCFLPLGDVAWGSGFPLSCQAEREQEESKQGLCLSDPPSHRAETPGFRASVIPRNSSPSLAPGECNEPARKRAGERMSTKAATKTEAQ